MAITQYPNMASQKDLALDPFFQAQHVAQLLANGGTTTTPPPTAAEMVASIAGDATALAALKTALGLD